ncbi:hypothetical protein ITQ94_08670 [Pediococcus pentosaceus]|uniref:hypothetical protein n=1 Tax=Pediococcus pentosaceus TaxID=1255 RepID=UPI0018FEF475|nr:hypothetical protein [Pediococcus pentosaceus]MBF7131509.1 hypothetical protein [Pediococcus pentosaceus]
MLKKYRSILGEIILAERFSGSTEQKRRHHVKDKAVLGIEYRCNRWSILTIYGEELVFQGDWIVSVGSKRWVVKDDVFHNVYEEVEDK